MNTPTPTPKLHTPRDYAAAVLAEASLERRRWLMERCPANWRPLVETMVKDGFGPMKAYRQHVAMRRDLEKQKPQAAPRREDTATKAVHKRGSVTVGNEHLARLYSIISKDDRS